MGGVGCTGGHSAIAAPAVAGRGTIWAMWCLSERNSSSPLIHAHTRFRNVMLFTRGQSGVELTRVIGFSVPTDLDIIEILSYPLSQMTQPRGATVLSQFATTFSAICLI